MPRTTLSTDAASITEIIPQVKRDIFNALVLKKPDTESRTSYFHVLALIVFISITTYTAFITSALLRLRIFKVIFAIIFPVVPALGCLFIAVFAYISGCVYAELLSDNNGKILYYMYTNLLGAVYLPLVVFIANVLNSFHYLLFLLVGVTSEFYCRTTFTKDRHFEDKSQKIHFIGVSMLTNLGFYVIIMPLFFAQ